MTKAFAWAALVLAAPLAATPAAAAVYTITYTGTISSGYDGTGVFGAADTFLNGQSFTAVHTLTAPLPGAITHNDGFNGYIYGGDGYGAPSPLSSVITIGGVSFAIQGQFVGQAIQRNGFPDSSSYDQLDHQTQDYLNSSTVNRHNYIYSGVYSFANNIVSSADYTAALDYTLQSGDTGYGDVYISDYRRGLDGQLLSQDFAYASLRPDRVTIALATSVPEPSAWALLILGFGATGGAMRGARRKTAAVTYA